MNRQLELISESFTIALADRVRALKAQGVPVIALQTGDPDFKTPSAIVDAAYQAMQAGYTHYSNSRGLPKLREAIAARIQTEQGIDYNPNSEILVTHGAIHAYYVALQALINRGDSVLVPDPSWQTHSNMVSLVYGTALRVPALPENNFFPTMQAWENLRRENTRAIVLNSPANPTGMVASQAYLEDIVAFAEKYNLTIISDEVYDNLLYDDAQHISLARLAKERTLLLNSFSKTYAMTGWRIGYLAASAPMIDAALKASQHTISNVAEFLQHAAILALTDSGVAAETRLMRAAYARRREMVLDIAAEFPHSPVKLIKPQGAFYFFLDVRELGMPVNEIAERLLNEQHVAIVPGSAYGQYGEGFLRMTTAAADADIAEGFKRLLTWAQAQ